MRKKKRNHENEVAMNGRMYELKNVTCIVVLYLKKAGRAAAADLQFQSLKLISASIFDRLES